MAKDCSKTSKLSRVTMKTNADLPELVSGGECPLCHSFAKHLLIAQGTAKIKEAVKQEVTQELRDKFAALMNETFVKMENIVRTEASEKVKEEVTTKLPEALEKVKEEVTTKLPEALETPNYNPHNFEVDDIVKRISTKSVHIVTGVYLFTLPGTEPYLCLTVTGNWRWISASDFYKYTPKNGK